MWNKNGEIVFATQKLDEAIFFLNCERMHWRFSNIFSISEKRMQMKGKNIQAHFHYFHCSTKNLKQITWLHFTVWYVFKVTIEDRNASHGIAHDRCSFWFFFANIALICAEMKEKQLKIYWHTANRYRAQQKNGKRATVQVYWFESLESRENIQSIWMLFLCMKYVFV